MRWRPLDVVADGTIKKARSKRAFRRDIGSPGRARTADLVINSHPLYRLSYRGTKPSILRTDVGVVNQLQTENVTGFQ